MVDISHTIKPTQAAIDAAWEAKGNQDLGHRLHLGASILGNDCMRSLWYTFRWCTDKRHTGRLLRLFDRGQEEEARFVRDLRMAGVTVQEVHPKTGRQFSFKDAGGHVGGSMDGKGIGLLESPEKWHVLEFKTHSDASFLKLSLGVKEAKPLHYAQMQIYMYWSGINRAFYMAVNKNDDSLYTERVKYDMKFADRLIRRAYQVVEAQRPLEGIAGSTIEFQCNFCDHKDTCSGQTPPAINCRTCLHSTPEMDGNGSWSCSKYNILIQPDQQRLGCSSHVFIPDLVNWLDAKAVDASQEDNWVEYQDGAGKVFRNGDGACSYSSQELINLRTGAAGDPNVEWLRHQWDGRVIASCK